MAEESVTLRNVSGGDLQLFAPNNTWGQDVAADGTVTVPGAVLAETEDALLIGPPGAALTVPTDPEDPARGEDPNPAVRAWPLALWKRVTSHAGRRGPRTDGADGADAVNTAKDTEGNTDEQR